MVRQHWHQTKNIVCIDSYEDGILQGRIYTPGREMETFSSLSQFLIRMEEMLDELQMPQSYTQPRKFTSVFQMGEESAAPAAYRKGEKATFELQIIFRQHTSWQGLLLWREEYMEHSFRSVLELILLMDSALRGTEGSDMEQAG